MTSLLAWSENFGVDKQRIQEAVRVTAAVRLRPITVGGSYSNTSFAASKTACGTAIPNAFAALLSTTNSNFVACSNGMSAGFCPLRMWSTKVAARLKMAGKSD
jgi:hypothetical protein